jgi:hypothetical protein
MGSGLAARYQPGAALVSPALSAVFELDLDSGILAYISSANMKAYKRSGIGHLQSMETEMAHSRESSRRALECNTATPLVAESAALP